MMARPVQVSRDVLPPDQRPAPEPRKPCKRCGLKNCKCIENRLEGQMQQAGFPTPVREMHWGREIGRGWRSEFGFPLVRILVEVEGGSWSGGAHVTGKGYEEDCIKYSEAAILGFCVVRVTGAMVRDGRALALIEKALKARGVRFGDGPAEYTRRYRSQGGT